MKTFKTPKWGGGEKYKNPFGKKKKNPDSKQRGPNNILKSRISKKKKGKKKSNSTIKKIRKKEPSRGDLVESTRGNPICKTNEYCRHLKSKRETMKLSLRERMLEQLKSSRFRYINEELYTKEGRLAKDLFERDPTAFEAYHEGYRQQVDKWPMNPLDVIIDSIRKMPMDKIIADMGCGDAKLAQTVRQKVHSFDLQAINEHVMQCEMSNVPLGKKSVDVVVFCLSLMGTNLRDFVFEANRILKIGGVLKIAEVQSRFETVEVFVDGVERFGFKLTSKDLSRDLFYFMEFKKMSDCKARNKLPVISLLPCLYKKR